jgi:hypothetical protein
MPEDRTRARRVFISHTSELGEFVEAAKSAIIAAGDVPVEMTSFAARDQNPAQVSREAVQSAHVYLLIAGFRYGSPVRDRPELSYTELEFEAAAEFGLPRLIFLLGEDTVGPAAIFVDPQHGARQAGFRRRLQDSGLTTKSISSPEQLESAVLQSLREQPRARAGGSKIWGIPAQSVRFTGRDELLAALHEGLSTKAIQAVHGMGGVGKTTMAIEYAHRFAADYDVAWWVPAEQPTLIPDNLAELARALRLADPTEGAEPALARLLGDLRHRDRWLIIFDNAEAPAALTRFLPVGPGHVIITSRNPDWHGIANSLPVEEFTRAESVSVLRSRAPHLSAADADRIADALGDLPLAVDQAAALLFETGLTADAYLSLLAQRPDEMVASSWAVAFDRLAEDDPAALQLLRLLAWLAPEPVPLTLITDHADLLPAELAAIATDPLALAKTTATLRSRAMVRTTPGTLLLHRIPAALLRTRDNEWAAATVVRLLNQTVPGDPWNNPGVWPAWRQLLPHVMVATDLERNLDSVATQIPWLLDAAGLYLATRGEARAALPLFERAYRLCRESLGEEDQFTLNRAHNFALDLRAVGEYKQALELDEETFARYRRVLGEDHNNTLRSANNLADDLRALGEFNRARELDEDTLQRRRRLLGEDHPDTLLSANNLAVDLHSLGDYQRALELDEETFARYKRVLGEDHPDALRSVSNLAGDLRALGQFERARDLDEDTLRRRRRVLGDDHPDTFISANNAAANLSNLGEHEQARKLDEDTLARRRRVLGKTHPDTLKSARNLVINLRALKQENQARAVEEEYGLSAGES